MDQGQVVSCPSGFINTDIPENSLPRIRTDSDGRSVYMFTCNRGYVASRPDPGAESPRQFTVQCRSDASGNITAPTEVSCVRGSCSLDALSDVKHATLNLSNASVPVDSTVTIACNEGFTIDGVAGGPRSRQLTCDQDARLTPLYPDNDCRAVSCGKVSVFENAQLLGDSL
jgi:hypothetical protein